ncbi:MAG: hypothetical protein NT144_13125 [Bacteroidia bacterium]|nr:hypothetical protein [Bacteroidia bacterium]
MDRQHPRDIFDLKDMFSEVGIYGDLKQGLLLCLLSSPRPLHELLNPALIDQKSTFKNQFSGMTREIFTYEEFEKIREKVISTIRVIITDSDKLFLISYKSGMPDWDINSFSNFKIFPAIVWKLQNINTLKVNSPSKHQEQLSKLKQLLYE